MERLTDFKVVIIGSGPAGCTAALYLARANLKPLVIEGMQPGGQLTITTDVENYPGFPDGILGPQLMELMRKQAERFGAVFRIENVENVELTSHPFTVTTDQHAYEAYAVIIASGASAMQIGIPSEKSLQGFGVSYCATCDGFFFKGKEIVVVGGGDSAMEEATFLTKFASKVTIVHRRAELRASKIMQERARSNPKISFILDSTVDEVVGSKDGGVTALKLRNLKTGATTTFPAQGLFVAIGHTPNTKPFEGQLTLDERGYIVQPHHHSTATSVQGVFACGDVVDHIYRQAVTAAGSGCQAALDCERWLTHERITERWGRRAERRSELIASRSADTILILGGAGMVGIQVAREAVRELHPSRIVIASLTEREVREAVEALKADVVDVEIIGAPGNIFLPQSLQGVDRAAILSDRKNYDALFAEIFSREVDSKESALFQLIDRFRPDVIVDAINTATAISYQDEFKIAQTTKSMLDALEERKGSIPHEDLQPLFAAVRELIISQGIPQIARHIMFLQRALEQTDVRIYVKVGTTGTGGMGFNVPYTHSEDKPSPQLLAKSAIGFAHTGLLFLLARTPASSSQEHGAIIKEVKPGAMIGFKSVARKHIRLRGESAPAHLLTPRQEKVGERLQLRDPAAYGRFEDRDVPLEIIGADTGENGFFSIGEFEAITYPRQMEYVTPEEVARTVILEIIGASTGRDVLAAIDGAITEPSYRAGVLREHAIREMHRLEDELESEVLPSIAIGHLGPPKLSKLLAEAHLILKAAATDDIAAIRRIAPEEMQRRVEAYVAANPRIVSQITTIGIPILREQNGNFVLTRGPRISIPPAGPEGTVVALDCNAIEKYAQTGWVDLRVKNFQQWNERLQLITSPDMQKAGSAAFDVATYPAQRFVPGDIVGWLLTNEPDEQGMVGRRLF